MTTHQFPVFSPAGIRVASAYECEAAGNPGEKGSGPLVLVRLGTTGLWMAPIDAFAFADLIMTAVAEADIELAKKLVAKLP